MHLPLLSGHRVSHFRDSGLALENLPWSSYSGLYAQSSYVDLSVFPQLEGAGVPPPDSVYEPERDIAEAICRPMSASCATRARAAPHAERDI